MSISTGASAAACSREHPVIQRQGRGQLVAWPRFGPHSFRIQGPSLGFLSRFGGAGVGPLDGTASATRRSARSIYREFFGRERLMSLPCASSGPRDGIVLALADSPAESRVQQAIKLQAVVGANAFASRRGPGPPKEIGQYVLTYEQLLAGGGEQTPA
jgi:hypothetical protein